MENTASRNANRRKSPRRRPRGTVRLECRKGSFGLGANLALNLLDVSDSGVRLVLTEPLQSGAEVEVLISGYGMRDTIKRLAVVRWQVTLDTGHFCVGIEFQKRIPYRDWQMLASPS